MEMLVSAAVILSSREHCLCVCVHRPTSASILHLHLNHGIVAFSTYVSERETSETCQHSAIHNQVKINPAFFSSLLFSSRQVSTDKQSLACPKRFTLANVTSELSHWRRLISVPVPHADWLRPLLCGKLRLSSEENIFSSESMPTRFVEEGNRYKRTTCEKDQEFDDVKICARENQITFFDG